MALLRSRPDYWPEKVAGKVHTSTGTGADAFNAAQTFTSPVFSVILTALINGAVFQFSEDGTTWTDDIIVESNVILGLDVSAAYWRVKNLTAGNNVTYKLMGLAY